MTPADRYDVSGLDEAQFEPGSRGRVLKNLLGIKKKRQMDRAETSVLIQVQEQMVFAYKRSHRFTAADICSLHKAWLRSIYSWAGQYRRVNLTKHGLPFSAAGQIPRLMQAFEAGPLQTLTPCAQKSRDELIKALAIVHAELVLIHPFRDGNGRLARLLAVAMALQAGHPPLDFRGVRGRKRQEYFAAVRAGLDKNYEPMQKIFSEILSWTLRTVRAPSN